MTRHRQVSHVQSDALKAPSPETRSLAKNLTLKMPYDEYVTQPPPGLSRCHMRATGTRANASTASLPEHQYRRAMIWFKLALLSNVSPAGQGEEPKSPPTHAIIPASIVHNIGPAGPLAL